MCGEHFPDALMQWIVTGSSPHVRGAPLRQCSRVSLCGIIPACAGSTICLFCCFLYVWDHPRMCGEHRDCSASRSNRSGSSPHVRGALWCRLSFLFLSGIIPACAGSTPSTAGGSTKARDHPRMCGEHLISHASPEGSTGSSPHVRGAQNQPIYEID